MDHVDVEKLKARLLVMQSELENLQSTGQGSAATVVLDQSSVGRLSRMDALQGQQMALEARRRWKQQLLQVRAALVRVENGEYGYCSACGEEIAVARLTINPVATHCVNCSQ